MRVRWLGWRRAARRATRGASALPALLIPAAVGCSFPRFQLFLLCFAAAMPLRRSSAAALVSLDVTSHQRTCLLPRLPAALPSPYPLYPARFFLPVTLIPLFVSPNPVSSILPHR